MPVERFYIDAPLQGLLNLEGPEHHHLVHVLRIRIGEEIELVNGKGSLAKAKVESLGRSSATLRILSSQTTPLPQPHLKLALPLMRPSKLEFVIEKCTELGADEFLLYPAHFSEKEDLSEHQMERLKHIAISAMKQCGRLDLPPIRLVSFSDLLTADTLLFGDLHTDEKPTPQTGSLVFVTGPEKGFFEKELQALKSKGQGVRLHRNILRAETAPMAVCVYYSSPTR